MNVTGSISLNVKKTVRLILSHFYGGPGRTAKDVNLLHRATTICFALIALMFLMTGISISSAQGAELFKSPETDKLQNIKDRTERVEKIRKRPTTNYVNLVSLNIAALDEGSMTIALPNGKVLNFMKKNVEKRNAGNYTWFGDLTDKKGNATLVIHDGNITGTIRDGNSLYRIEPVGNGIHAVIKVDQSRFPADHPPAFKDKEKQGGAAALPAVYDASASTNPVGIDVLVAYTPASRTAVSNMEALIQLAVDEANESYKNSNININLKLVDRFEVSYAESDKSFEKVLSDFVGMGEVNSRRNSSSADLAVMIIDKPDYCGLANAILANASNAYAVVHYDCATGYYSFAHEIGHLQGARHDPANDPTLTPFSYGHGFQYIAAPSSWRTIMAYNCAPSCQRLNYWSNPNVIYNGYAMGTAATNDNARVLNETARTIAGFRPLAPANLKLEAIK